MRELLAARGRWFLAAGVGLLFSLSSRGETWTNQAGHVVTARLLAIQDGQAVLQRTNGTTFRLALASLKPADQQRALAQQGTESLPIELRDTFGQAEEDIRRAAQFLQGGRITAEEYAARCQMVKQRFEGLGSRFFKDKGEAPDPALIAHLGQRLDQLIGAAAASPLGP